METYSHDVYIPNYLIEVTIMVAHMCVCVCVKGNQANTHTKVNIKHIKVN